MYPLSLSQVMASWQANCFASFLRGKVWKLSPKGSVRSSIFTVQTKRGSKWPTWGMSENAGGVFPFCAAYSGLSVRN